MTCDGPVASCFQTTTGNKAQAIFRGSSDDVAGHAHVPTAIRSEALPFVLSPLNNP